MTNMLWCCLWFTVIGCFVTVTESADGDVRLAGNARTYMGRVEIESGSTWYSVCNVGWGIEEADVVCQQLGFPDGAMFSSVSPRSDFGIGTGNTLWSDYDCSGSEPNFSSCGNGGLSSTPCDISDDVAIICNVPAYLGCYEIPEEEYPPDLKRVSSAKGSIEVCLEACRTHSTYAALGIQGEEVRCFCFSGDYNTLTAASNERCSTTCLDDDRAACGGLNAYSVYPVTLGEPGATYTDVDTGFIYSPNFFGMYVADLDTTWTLSFTDSKIVTLNSIMFLLDSDDSLTISDGNSDDTYDSNLGSLVWTSDATSTVTLQFNTADDSDGNYGFLLEYSTSDAPIVTTESVTTKPATTENVVTTNIATTMPDEPTTTLVDTTPARTTEVDMITTIEVIATSAVAGTTGTTGTTLEGTEATTEITTENTTPQVEETTLMNTEPACPVSFGSSSISNQVNSNSNDQLIVAYDTPFECDTLVASISLYASADGTYTLFVIRQSQSDLVVVSRADITSPSPNVVDQDFTTSVIATAGDLLAIAFEANSFSYSDGHSGTMNFTVYDTAYSGFDTVSVGDILSLPDSGTDVERQYPFKLTMRPAVICDLSINPRGGSYSVSSLLESQSTTLVCRDGYKAEFNDDQDDNDNDNINVTCSDDGTLIHSGSCKDNSYNTTYIIIFTTIVACLGFCLIIVYFAILCSRPEGTSGGGDIEKAPSDENTLLPIPDQDDDVDFAVDEVEDEEEAEEDEAEDVDDTAADTNEPEGTGSQEDGDQSNPPSSTGEVGNVDNPIYQSNEWVPEEAGPDD